MVVVDTSAWIEWLIGSPLAPRIRPLLPPQSEWVVPTIVQLELAKWLSREVGEERACPAWCWSTSTQAESRPKTLAGSWRVDLEPYSSAAGPARGASGCIWQAAGMRPARWLS